MLIARLAIVETCSISGSWGAVYQIFGLLQREGCTGSADAG